MQGQSLSYYEFVELKLRLRGLGGGGSSPILPDIRILIGNPLAGKAGATTLSITTFSIMTLSMRCLFVTLSIRDNQHK